MAASLVVDVILLPSLLPQAVALALELLPLGLQVPLQPVSKSSSGLGLGHSLGP